MVVRGREAGYQNTKKLRDDVDEVSISQAKNTVIQLSFSLDPDIVSKVITVLIGSKPLRSRELTGSAIFFTSNISAQTYACTCVDKLCGKRLKFLTVVRLAGSENRLDLCNTLYRGLP